MPGAQRVPPSEEVPWLRARVAELEAGNEVMAAQLAARDAQLEAVQARLAVLAEQIEELRRRLGKDSPASPEPPSSDSPHKKPKARSLRTRSGRKPGKQPGAPSSTLRQSPDPDDTVTCGPAACGSCSADLADAPVIAVKKRQVIEYQVVAKKCPACGETATGAAPTDVTSLVQYGPGVHAMAALAVCANYVPVARAARLVAAFTAVNVSAGFVAGVRGKAASRLDPFMDRVRALLRQARVLLVQQQRGDQVLPALTATRWLLACVGEFCSGTTLPSSTQRELFCSKSATRRAEALRRQDSSMSSATRSAGRPRAGYAAP